jgi:hypothetical protein
MVPSPQAPLSPLRRSEENGEAGESLDQPPLFLLSAVLGSPLQL